MAGISKREKIKDYLQCLNFKKKKSLLEKFLTILLFILSIFYSSILMVRLFLYDFSLLPVYRSKLRVISVGNITVGGTGKTPLVAMIAEFLTRKKQKVAIISRGYKSMISKMGLVADEPLMLTKLLPEADVIIDQNRLGAIKSLEEKDENPIVILDDAFQNFRIKKTLDIVCISCLNPFGNGYVLPRGILRLPFRYLKKADIFVLTHYSKKDLNVPEIMRILRKYNSKALIVKTTHVPVCFYDFCSNEQQSLDSIRGGKAAIICGIAQPDNFRSMLESLAVRVELKFYFPDHYNFTGNDVQDIISECNSQGVSLIVTTAKDEPRLKLILNQDLCACHNLKILVLRVSIKLEENEERFTDHLSSIFTA